MKDARYFKHDSNARYDPKIKSLIKNHGLKGYGIFWVIIEMMREASHYRLPDKEYVYESIAEDCKCEAKEIKEFMKNCSEKFELFELNEGYYYSNSFLKRMYDLEEIRKKRSEAAISRWSS